MKKIMLVGLIALSLTACSSKDISKENNTDNGDKHIQTTQVENQNNTKNKIDKEKEAKEIKKIENTYKNQKPTEWSENISGVVTNLDTNKKQIALTLDACGGKNGSKYDKELIDFLEKEKIPATLFINYRWIEANKDTFMKLANNSNFLIENHGYEHRPLSVTKNSIYNIEGTDSVENVIKEIKLNEDKIYELTGKRTTYFRSGTAYYDDIAVKIAESLGYKIAGFSVNGDGGATFSKEEVIDAVSKAKSGDIIISHFNQPRGYTYEGLKEALIKLKEDGYKFVKLN